MGITGIDRDEIITQSWSTPYKLKKKAPMGKVLSKAFELLKIPYSRDWFTFEDKIISFKPLDNRDEEFRYGLALRLPESLIAHIQ